MKYGEIKQTELTCPNCGGRGGWIDGDEGQFVTCLRCQGTGEIPSPQLGSWDSGDGSIGPPLS